MNIIEYIDKRIKEWEDIYSSPRYYTKVEIIAKIDELKTIKREIESGETDDN